MLPSKGLISTKLEDLRSHAPGGSILFDDRKER